MQIKSSIASLTIGAAAMLGGSLAAYAQEAAAPAPAGVEEEIVVTAQRRSERVQDVPIALSVFSGEQLEARSAINVADALAAAPNVAATGGASGRGDANFFVRGVGQVDNSITVDPGVGVYLDEVYIGRLQGAAFDLFDIERIEILRGPQGTLWGKNTIGGAVSIITTDPQPGETFGRARATIGSRDRVDGLGVINLGLGERFAVSASALIRREDGWATNALTGRTMGDTKVEGVRAKLRADITERLSLRVSGDYINQHGTPLNYVLLAFNPTLPGRGPAGPPPGPGLPPPTRPIPGLSPTGVPFPPDTGSDRGDRDTSFNSIPLVDTTKTGGIQATLSWDLGFGEVKSITAYRELTRRVYNDFDGTGYRLYDSLNTITQNQFSQEVHLTGELFDDRLRYVTGLYYFSEKANNNVNLCTGTNGPRLTGACFESQNPIRIDVDSYAAFANLNFAVTEQLSLTAGARYTYEEKIQDFASQLVNFGVRGPGLPVIFVPPGGTFVALPPSEVSADFDAWTPKFGVDWKVRPNLLLYFSYAEGFKSGGFTGRPSNSEITAYDPETVTTYEIGAKWTPMSRFYVNLAAFHSKYDAIQLLIQLPGGTFDTTNAGNATIDGIELEAFGQVTDRLSLNLSVGWLDAGYDELAPNVFGLQITDRLPRVSDWSVSVGAQYRQPVSDSANLTLRADYQWRSEFAFQLENDAFEMQPGYGTLNLRAGFDWADGRYAIAAYGLNVLDKTYFLNKTDGFSTLGVAVGIPAQPAQWALEFSARF